MAKWIFDRKDSSYSTEGNKNILEVYFAEGTTSIPADCCHCSLYTEIKSVIIPGSVKVIGANAFYLCGRITIILQERVEEIGSGAFYDSYPDEIIIPSTLKIVKSMPKGGTFTYNGKDVTGYIKSLSGNPISVSDMEDYINNQESSEE